MAITINFDDSSWDEDFVIENLPLASKVTDAGETWITFECAAWCYNSDCAKCLERLETDLLRHGDPVASIDRR